MTRWDDAHLYDAARQVCHEHGLPWTDPRTGLTHEPPQKATTMPSAPTYELLTVGGVTAIRCGLCDRISELPGDVENRYCGRCHMFLDMIAALRKEALEHGATHDCGEWWTYRGVCAICGEPRSVDLVLRTGDRVWVTFAGTTTVATVLIAAGNGRSVMLGFDALLGGYLGTMPISWTGRTFVDLLDGREVVVTPYPS